MVKNLHLEILVEELSAEAALKNLLPKILGDNVSFKIIPHQGKKDLLKKLPQKLKAYSKWIDNQIKLVVLIDLDKEDCKKLKSELNRIAKNSGLKIKTTIGELTSNFQILNRIAIEELESWFLGDKNALIKTYPKLKPKIFNKSKFRNPDAIKDPWEELERILQKNGYYSQGLEKIQNARLISSNMDINNNASKSFNCFQQSLKLLIS
ncbi:MAG: DUF4276 family protein [Candidatus Omnitrophica bacterium]|nr:DUF4276 family protein [Candidatus Omnitrophota bacterium]